MVIKECASIRVIRQAFKSCLPGPLVAILSI